jgi:integrase
MKQMLRTLYQIGRLDVLRDIKAGLVPVQDVYERFRLGRLDQLPSGVLMRPLGAAWDEWLQGKEIAASTRHDYELALCRLTPTPATLTDLPRLLQAHRKQSRGHRPRTFNKDRAAVLSFLQSALGAHHWLYGECARATPLKIPQSVKLPINPLTVEQAKKLAEKIPPGHLFSFWGLLLTGMRPEEWFEQVGCRWEIEGDGVKIAGTKRPASNRTVPRVGEIVRPMTGRLAFYRALRKASDDTVAPYDLRRSYAVWLELAGIPEYRQSYYMAHGPKDLNALYKRQRDCLPHLQEDGIALMQVLASPQKSPTSGER